MFIITLIELRDGDKGLLPNWIIIGMCLLEATICFGAAEVIMLVAKIEHNTRSQSLVR